MWGSSASKAYGRGGRVKAMAFRSPGLQRGRGWCVPFAPPADEPGQDREENHPDDHEVNVLGHARDPLAEEKSEEQHAPDPRGAAEDAECEEFAVVHAA